MTETKTRTWAEIQEEITKEQQLLLTPLSDADERIILLRIIDLLEERKAVNG